MTYLLTLGVAFVSAWIPLVNIEAYLIALLTQTSVSAWAMALAAAVGQSAGKVLIFLSARGVVTSARLERWRARREHRGAARWGAWITARMEGRAGLAVVLLSAFVGFPPLLLVAVLAGTTRMPVVGFAAACLVGRWGRFFVILVAPGLLFG